MAARADALENRDGTRRDLVVRPVVGTNGAYSHEQTIGQMDRHVVIAIKSS